MDIKYDIIRNYKKDATETTIKAHINNINKIIDVCGDIFNNYDLIKDKILNDDTTLYTKKNKISSLIVYLRATDTNDDLINKYSELIEILTNRIDKQKFKKTKKENDNWITIEEIKNKLCTLKQNIKKEPKTYNELKYYIKYIIFYFHTEIESLRNDLCDLIIDNNDDINYNTYDDKKGIIKINKYKTEKTHGQIKIKLTKTQKEIMNDYIKSLNYYKRLYKIDNNYFLISSNGDKIKRNNYTKIFKTIYDDKIINVNMIRKIMASNNCNIKQIKQKAERMGHTLQTHLNSYVKE